MKNNKKEILNELSKNNGGFKTPVNYFSDFEKNFLKKKETETSGYISPENYFLKLENEIINKTKKFKEPKTTGFKTPDNYFEEFDIDLDKRLSSHNTKIVNLNTRKYFKIIAYSVAASLLLFFGLNNFVFDKNNYNIESIQIAEIEKWIDEDLISFNSYDIDETFSDVELTIANDYSDEILEYLDYSEIENLIIEN